MYHPETVLNKEGTEPAEFFWGVSVGIEELQMCYCPVPTPCAEYDQSQHRTSYTLIQITAVYTLLILSWAGNPPVLVFWQE